VTHALDCEHVTKTYRIGVGRARVREMLPFPFDRVMARTFPRWWAKDTFDALRDVSVRVSFGDSVGIVGHNGAGKTTLLKVIAGVTAPTRGTVSTAGRIGALIDLLVGFHPDLTGRENVFILGAMHGVGRKAMAARLESVLDFAEIHELADTPVKRYSSGMQARLGFATLVGIEPEILLIDEVLAVGDAAFQRKCIAWFDDFRSAGGTLVFVSHNLGLVRSMTDRAIWLDHGTVAGEGATAGVLAEYAKSMERRHEATVAHRKRGLKKAVRGQKGYRWGAGAARVQEVHVDEGAGGRLDISITYEASDLDSAIFCVGFVDDSGRQVGAAASPQMSVNGGRGTVQCSMRRDQLRSGIYFPVAAILGPDGTVQDRWRLDRAVVVDPPEGTPPLEDFGPVDLPARWSGE
jgi:ABC-type polysaccharide/polyol phosphate transport system ATPase subunit